MHTCRVACVVVHDAANVRGCARMTRAHDGWSVGMVVVLGYVTVACVAVVVCVDVVVRTYRMSRAVAHIHDATWCRVCVCVSVTTGWEGVSLYVCVCVWCVTTDVSCGVRYRDRESLSLRVTHASCTCMPCCVGLPSVAVSYQCAATRTWKSSDTCPKAKHQQQHAQSAHDMNTRRIGARVSLLFVHPTRHLTGLHVRVCVVLCCVV